MSEPYVDEWTATDRQLVGALNAEKARNREWLLARLARARHRWQHPTFPFGRGRCGCEGWAATIGDMLDLLDSDEGAS